MAAPIALQLYTVRNALSEDFAGVINQVAEIGYVGVETGSQTIADEPEKVQLLRSLDLQVPSVHIRPPLDEHQQAALDKVAVFGCKYVTTSLPHDQFKSVEQIKGVSERLNATDALVRDRGLTLTCHNHWWEFVPLADGRIPFWVMFEYLNPTILFEVDVYWAKTGGTDPVETLKRLGARAPLLHIKDGPAELGKPMTAVGEGTLDIPAIIDVSRATAEWLIVELDECATDMMEAVSNSYKYLVSNGLVRGKK